MKYHLDKLQETVYTIGKYNQVSGVFQGVIKETVYIFKIGMRIRVGLLL